MSRQDANAAFARTSFLYGGNADYVDELYARYEADPQSVDGQWRAFFESLKDDARDVVQNAEGPSWARADWPPLPRGDLVAALDGDWDEVGKAVAEKVQAKAQARGVELTEGHVQQATRDSVRALMLIRAYRMRGHLHANLDPLGLEPRKDPEELDPRSYGFTDADLDRPIFLDHVLGLEFGTLRQMLSILQRTYCQTLGVEFMHISDPQQKGWIQERIEGPDKEISFTREGKRAILNKLVEAEGFEKFSDLKFTGTKRFGLDGGESMIPALEQIIKRGGALGVKDIALGMAHRGRLNVLAHVLAKPHRAIFHEFKGGSSSPDDADGSGDVKYHLGASSDREFDGNKVHLSLTANPSHLEIVNPVVLGKTRAKQDQLGATPEDRTNAMPLLISGDAAFAGQGVIAECFGLSGLRGHRTGGSVHFIVNNQIGFTTYPRYSRSSPYPSDVAKMIEAPIFHANGDDPEAVVFAAKIATEFRQKFQKPVVIDMFCYRRHGHNEGDEPMFTQPLMYKAIASHPTTLEIYSKKLIAEGVVTQGEVDKMKSDWRARLDAELEASVSYKSNKADWLDGRWAGLQGRRDVGRSAPRQHRRRARDAQGYRRQDHHGAAGLPSPPHHPALPRIAPQGDRDRRGDRLVDRGGAGVLLLAARRPPGAAVRPGQRARHVLAAPLGADRPGEREPLHAVQLHPPRPGALRGRQLDALRRSRARLRVRLFPRRAERADHVGGAVRRLRQRRAGDLRPVHLVGRAQMAAHVGPRLPPAARLRGPGPGALLGAARTLPAALRRGQHAGRELHDPGELLPHPAPPAQARDQEAADPDDAEEPAAPQAGGLEARRDGRRAARSTGCLWDDAQLLPGEKIKLVADDKMRRVVLCSGKVYYDLYEEREKRGVDDVYLLRIEQLYPVPMKALIQELSRFKDAEVVWCQEEPRNMGAWHFIEPYIEWVLNQVGGVSRRPVMPGGRPRRRRRAGLPRSTSPSSRPSSTKRFLENRCQDSSHDRHSGTRHSANQ